MTERHAEALSRLVNNTDFKEFVSMLENEKKHAERKLLASIDNAFIFRYQGEVVCLNTILERIRDADKILDKFRK